jgi:hypothetical protein
MKSNRFQVELDKIAMSCKQCDKQDCCQCSLNYRKLEFQYALKESEAAISRHTAELKAQARIKRERPLTGHMRVATA